MLSTEYDTNLKYKERYEEQNKNTKVKDNEVTNRKEAPKDSAPVEENTEVKALPKDNDMIKYAAIAGLVLLLVLIRFLVF